MSDVKTVKKFKKTETRNVKKIKLSLNVQNCDIAGMSKL